jgi:hypothetical protein
MTTYLPNVFGPSVEFTKEEQELLAAFRAHPLLHKLVQHLLHREFSALFNTPLLTLTAEETQARLVYLSGMHDLASRIVNVAEATQS